MIFLSLKPRIVLAGFLAVLCFSTVAFANPAVIQTKLRRIVIDPGHGGAASGAVGYRGTKEKDVVLGVATILGRLIEEQLPDVKVYYTRTKDVDVDLAQRGRLANQQKADLFISIHANSNKTRSETASGTETFVMGLDKSDNNLAVARLENAAILNESDYSTKYEGYDPNSPESFILFSLIQNSYLDQSITLASMIEDAFVSSKRKSRGVKQAPFLVLWRTGMPSVLIEIGFISNPAEEEYMKSEKGQYEIAANVLEAIKSYKGVIEGKNGITTNNTAVVKTPITPTVVPAVIETPAPEPTPAPVEKASVVTPVLVTKTTVLNVTPKGPFKSIGEAIVKTQETLKASPCYGIQLSSSRSLLDTKKEFKRIEEVFYFKKDGLYKYYTGCYPTRGQAQLELAEIRKIVEGAFVIQVNSVSGTDK